MVPTGLVYSIHDSTEKVAIQKMVDASQSMIRINSQGELGEMSPPIKRHLELEVETLQNAPGDADKLEWLLQVKQRQNEEAMHIQDTQKGWRQRDRNVKSSIGLGGEKNTIGFLILILSC